MEILHTRRDATPATTRPALSTSRGPPDAMRLFLRGMPPAIPHDAHVAMRKGLLEKSPPAADDAIARPHLPARDLAELDDALATR